MLRDRETDNVTPWAPDGAKHLSHYSHLVGNGTSCLFFLWGHCCPDSFEVLNDDGWCAGFLEGTLNLCPTALCHSPGFLSKISASNRCLRYKMKNNERWRHKLMTLPWPILEWRLWKEISRWRRYRLSRRVRYRGPHREPALCRKLRS